MYVIGISAYYHDSALALFKDGKLLFACEEEKFSGIKHDSSFPKNTLKYVYEHYNIQPWEIDAVCFYENPELKVDRVWNNFMKNFIDSPIPMIQSLIGVYLNKWKLEKQLKKISTNVHYYNHHDSHIYYSYYTSPFEDAAILSIDGVGESETLCVGYVKDGTLDIVPLATYPHSVGLFYAAMTSFLGFKPNEGEYKVMGLASYGNPKKFQSKMNRLLIHSCVSLKCNMQFFEWDRSHKIMFNENLSDYLGMSNRLPEDEITQDHMDLAAAVQEKYERVFYEILKDISLYTHSDKIALGGGCAYNGTANGKIKSKTKFKSVWIPPAPSDAGSAIGCVLGYYHERCRIPAMDNNPFLGPTYEDVDVVATEYFKRLIGDKPNFKVSNPNQKEMYKNIAKKIREGKVIGWFNGRIEFGARALGHRSILADPTVPDMRDRINKVIKKREGFRPFAPMVDYDCQEEFFETGDYIPYMNQVIKMNEKYIDKLPSVVHVDGTSRIQSVLPSNVVYPLIKEFEKLSGFPILLNTSFNVKDKTMVLTPKDAIETFLDTEMDILVLDGLVIEKV